MPPNTAGLIIYGLVTAAVVLVVLLAERDRGFPLPLARRACAVVLGLDSALAWIAIGSDDSLLTSPGWLMTLALAGAASLVASLGTLIRAVSLPLWLRIAAGVSCLLAGPALALLMVA